MRILVTGSGGFIGSNLCKHLEPGHIIYKLIRAKSDNFDSRTFRLDLTDIETVQNSLLNSGFGKIEVDLIIHCAAVMAKDDNQKDIELFLSNNKITESLILISKHFNPKKVINFSTIGVYANSDGNYSETSFVRPSGNAECLYSLAKFCSEELLSYLLKEITVVNLRLSQTYGEGMHDDRIYSLFLRELKETNKITVWGNGARISNFISISYLLKCVDKIIVLDEMKGTFNVGEKNMSYYELAQSIIEKYGNQDSEIAKVEKGVKSKVVIDCSKFEKYIKDE